MAWQAIPSVAAGSLVRASDIGAWLTTVRSQADTITRTHCTANYSRHYSNHRSSVNSSNNGIWSSDDGVGTTNGRKCGGSISLG